MLIMSSINRFVLQHNKKYINYCEAIILPNGDIEYAIPSHQHKLKEIWGVPYNPYSETPSRAEQVLWNIVPPEADVCEWLCEDLKCISVWYNYVVIPINYTEESLNSYLELVKNKCVSKESLIKVSIEKSLINLRNQESFKELDDLINFSLETQRHIEKKVSSI